jgi:Transposase DDE domain group 1
VTSLAVSSRAVLRFYNKRGTAEQWIKEGKQAVAMTRLSCHRFRSNEVRLWLSLIAYNLGNLWRRLALPTRIGKWSLTSVQQRLVKTGGRLIKHARYYWLLLAESHLTGGCLVACWRVSRRSRCRRDEASAKVEQISMTTLGRREKCPRNRSEKGHFRALRAHQMRIRPSRCRW